jgi:hypothetical protein
MIKDVIMREMAARKGQDGLAAPQKQPPAFRGLQASSDEKRELSLTSLIILEAYATAVFMHLDGRGVELQRILDDLGERTRVSVALSSATRSCNVGQAWIRAKLP